MVVLRLFPRSSVSGKKCLYRIHTACSGCVSFRRRAEDACAACRQAEEADGAGSERDLESAWTDLGLFLKVDAHHQPLPADCSHPSHEMHDAHMARAVTCCACAD